MSSNEDGLGEPAAKTQRVDVTGNRAAGVSRDYDISFLRAALAAAPCIYLPHSLFRADDRRPRPSSRPAQKAPLGRQHRRYGGQ